MGKNYELSLPPSTDETLTSLLEELDRKLADPSVNRYDLMRQFNLEICYCDARTWEQALAASHSPADRLRVLNLDARNVTLEPEIYAEKDPARFDRVKPLLHTWQVFDSTPLGANVLVGQRVRYTLAKHIFNRIGTNVKFFRWVEFSFGYNISCGDNVVFHRSVLVDDRAPVEIGDNASLSDFVNVYSHTHDVLKQSDVTCLPTRIGKGVRLTYHSTVLCGSQIGEDAMIGTFGLVTGRVNPGDVALGIPARPKKNKNDVRRERGLDTRSYES